MSDIDAYRHPITPQSQRRERRAIVAQHKAKVPEMSPWKTFLVNYFSAFIAFPLVRLKVIAQCLPDRQLSGKQMHYNTGWETAKHIPKNEGFFKMWRGFAAYSFYTIPTLLCKQYATGVIMSEAQRTNKSSYNNGDGISFFTTLKRTMMPIFFSSVLSSLWTVFDIAATKMEADARPKRGVIYDYRNMRSTIIDTRRFGGTSSLFVGAIPNLCKNMTYWLGLMFASAILRPNSYHTKNNETKTRPLLHSFGLNLVACLPAVALSHPFDTIARRMQYRLPTQVIDPLPRFQGMKDCATYIWKTEGMKGFYRGWQQAYIAIPVTMAITTLFQMRNYKKQLEYGRDDIFVEERERQVKLRAQARSVSNGNSPPTFWE